MHAPKPVLNIFEADGRTIKPPHISKTPVNPADINRIQIKPANTNKIHLNPARIK